MLAAAVDISIQMNLPDKEKPRLERGGVGMPWTRARPRA
jgi:hypothetical protein